MSSEPGSYLQCRSLGREDPLEKGTATHSSVPAWRIPWTEEPGGLQSTGHKESDTAEQLYHRFRLGSTDVKILSSWYSVRKCKERRPACVLRITGRSAGDFTFAMVDACALQNHSCFM